MEDLSVILRLFHEMKGNQWWSGGWIATVRLHGLILAHHVVFQEENSPNPLASIGGIHSSVNGYLRSNLPSWALWAIHASPKDLIDGDGRWGYMLHPNLHLPFTSQYIIIRRFSSLFKLVQQLLRHANVFFFQIWIVFKKIDKKLLCKA